MSDDDESLLTYLAGMDARIDRLEGQLEQVLSALATLTEIGLLTYAATGTKTTIPAEVLGAPIAERAIQRHAARLATIHPSMSKERPSPAALADLFLHGTPEQIAAEPRLANAVEAQCVMELHIDEVFRDDPDGIHASYAESRQMIADTLARGQDISVRQDFEPSQRSDRQQGAGSEQER